MTRLTVTFDQEVGDKITVVPMVDGQRFMIALGRRQAEGGIFLELPQAQVALLLSKLTAAFMAMEAPPAPTLDAGVTTAGDVSLGVLASLRARLEARGAELTAPADDCGPRETEHQRIAGMLQSLAEGADPDQIRAALALAPRDTKPPPVPRLLDGANVIDLLSLRGRP